ncbi:MAG: nuclease-related domain-containing protein, partial [Acidobacteriota bacterium]
MAYIIPETLHNLPNVTPGEASLFRLFQQKLDDRTYVWFNIPIRRRHADFIILNPQLGLLTIEVKDWQLSQMRVVSPTHIILKTGQGERKVAHPLRQARDYALQIAD